MPYHPIYNIPTLLRYRIAVAVSVFLVKVESEAKCAPIGKHYQQTDDVKRPNQYRIKHVPVSTEGNV